ncbi:peptidase dimerization domain-containing protein, partial [Pseudomonas sp. GW460-13]
ASLRHTAAPTQLHAGYAVNVIPAEATATIDCRVLPGHEEEFFHTVDTLLRTELGEDYEALTIEWEQPNAVSSDPHA